MAEFNKAANDATDDGPTLTQLRSWLGSELAIGVLDVPTNGADPTVLGFAEVRDQAQLEAAITKDKDTRSLGKHGDYDLFGSKDDAVVAISADTALISNAKGVTEAAIDRLGGTGDRLADLSTYKDTLASLPSDNIVVGYAPGSVLQKLVTLGRQKDPTGSTDSLSNAQFDKITEALAGVRSFGFSLGATENGLRIRGTSLLSSDSKSFSTPYEPTLLTRVPASSWLAASFGDVGVNAKSAVDQVIASNPSAKEQVAQAEAALGIKLDDVYALLSGEHALFAGPGAPVSAGMILHPEDVQRGATTLKALTKLLTQQGIVFTDTADGQKASVQGFTVYWRAVDDVHRHRHRPERRRRRQGLDRRQRQVQARARRGRRRHRLEDARPRVRRRAQPGQPRERIRRVQGRERQGSARESEARGRAAVLEPAATATR